MGAYARPRKSETLALASVVNGTIARLAIVGSRRQSDTAGAITGTLADCAGGSFQRASGTSPMVPQGTEDGRRPSAERTYQLPSDGRHTTLSARESPAICAGNGTSPEAPQVTGGRLVRLALDLTYHVPVEGR